MENVVEKIRAEVVIRPMREADLAAADHIMRLAFGTFLGLPEPTAFMGDASYIRNRFLADPAAAFAAEAGDALIGSNMATNWGSVGFFGPLTIRPDHWDRGVGKRLMEPIMSCFERWSTKQAGLFTFAHSPKHVGLYQSFGFWPRFLTAITSKPVAESATGLVAPAKAGSRWTPFSDVPPAEREETLRACRELTDAVYEGLDVGSEIRAVAARGLGETVLSWDEGKLTGLAICHCGPGTEAGSGACYVKFGAARPGPAGARNFDRLLDAVEAMAAARGLPRVVAGVNAARAEAYRAMRARGFRADFQGVAMHRGNEPGYNRAGSFVIDDWR